MEATLSLYKRGQTLDQPHGENTLLPTFSQQAKWRFAKTPDSVRLSDGNNVYHFKMTDGEHEDQDFPLIRVNGTNTHNFEDGATSKGLAQVHRADPGSIYFTMQEGRKNPTYTYRHVGGEHWRAIPKKKKIKSEKIIENIDATQVKQAFIETVKEANFGHDLNLMLGQAASRIPEATKSIALSPGESQNPINPALLGGGAGLAYDLFRKGKYNTPEENEHDGVKQTLMRTLIPAVGLGGANIIERSALNPYYQNLELNGHRPQMLGHSGDKMTVPLVNPSSDVD